MIVVLHVRIHLVASPITVIMIIVLAPVIIMMLHLGLWTLTIQGVVVITFNELHY